MPSKPGRPCRYPRCPKVVKSKDGYCDEHRKVVSKKYEATRETAVARGYDSRWQKVRANKLKRNSLCEKHLDNGVIVPATLVHHIDRNSRNNRGSNLMSLCRACHELIHYEAGERW